MEWNVTLCLHKRITYKSCKNKTWIYDGWPRLRPNGRSDKSTVSVATFILRNPSLQTVLQQEEKSYQNSLMNKDIYIIQFLEADVFWKKEIKFHRKQHALTFYQKTEIREHELFITASDVRSYTEAGNKPKYSHHLRKLQV